MKWTPCGRLGAFQCAKVLVPEDESNPGAATVALGVAKLPALNSALRIGTLFVNPGGPGGSAEDSVFSAPYEIPREIRRRFDIVGFDPRGVGQSPHVSCGSVPRPTRIAEALLLLAQACAKVADPALVRLDTVTTADDMDRIREALGEARISFLGFSYGTELGLVYADRHADHLRALVLDSPVDAQTPPPLRAIAELAATERALDAFLDTCARLPRQCAFNDGTDLRERYLDALTLLRATPIKASDGSRTLTADVLARLVATNVGDSAVWTQLARLLAIIASQSGDPFATYPQRAAPLGPPVDNQELLTVYLGTVCRDGFMPLPAEIEAIATDLAKAAPRFAAVSDIATGAGECATWPVHGVPPEIRVPIMGGHFVVVSALLDVATPTEIAKALAERHGASFVTYDDATHGVYGQDRCVNAAVDAYLINLTDPGTVNC